MVQCVLLTSMSHDDSRLSLSKVWLSARRAGKRPSLPDTGLYRCVPIPVAYLYIGAGCCRPIMRRVDFSSAVGRSYDDDLLRQTAAHILKKRIQDITKHTCKDRNNKIQNKPVKIIRDLQNYKTHRKFNVDATCIHKVYIATRNVGQCPT